MARRLILTLIALILACTLAAGAWQLAGTPEQARMSRLSPADAVSIRLQRPDRPPVSLERRNGDWWVTQPEERPASGTHVRALLRILDEPQPETRFAAADSDPATYGLEPPSAVLEINGQRWHFGDRHPLGEQRYVLHRGEIALLPDHYAPLVRGPWQQLTAEEPPR
ncbi:hypothetical protein ACN2MM_14025 [Alkalilimnicola ehrlichii MLHE-1]|uniref:DUF4340 domain-containing protein n=1 Tax=Alkalilimnicola ehrlichii (strain ATCC BAA-1101 / DSM 17681 / MLHE-1) TaxID=187272 RepID=Q0A599_ALKEH|nr:hypothetical protein [Alkalilimnicola ehrlichii]ABI57988.1 hypothetical protein Mlg_2648 [Alkalilimnicola ehrlichii MLHE-1]